MKCVKAGKFGSWCFFIAEAASVEFQSPDLRYTQRETMPITGELTSKPTDQPLSNDRLAFR